MIHINGHYLKFPGTTDTLSMVDYDNHSYVPLSSCVVPADTSSPSTATLYGYSSVMVSDGIDSMPCAHVKRIVDRVHAHVCGHSTFADMRVFLQRNQMWNNSISQYLPQTVNDCMSCLRTSALIPNRKVSIKSLSRSFNEVVCIDHFYVHHL